jgi:hypothetical protein
LPRSCRVDAAARLSRIEPHVTRSISGILSPCMWRCHFGAQPATCLGACPPSDRTVKSSVMAIGGMLSLSHTTRCSLSPGSRRARRRWPLRRALIWLVHASGAAPPPLLLMIPGRRYRPVGTARN